MENNNSKLKIPLTILSALLLIGIGIWFLRLALAPFFAAMVFTYLLWPAYAFLRKKARKSLSAIVVVFSGTLVAIAAIWGVVAVFDGQVRRLLSLIPQIKDTFETRMIPLLKNHPWIMEKIQAAADSFDPMLFVRGISGAGLGVVGWILQALSFALVPLIVYYLLLDGPRWLVSAESLVPPRLRADVRQVVREINERLGGFIRGELLVITTMSFLQGLAFAILGVPYPWLLGLIAGVSNIVPYSPYVTALPLAIVLVALKGSGWGMALAITITFTIVQKAEGFYLTPVWVGKASHLHPLEVLLALLCFGFAFGVMGLIFAVPLMIVAKVVGGKLLSQYRTHPWFEKGEA